MTRVANCFVKIDPVQMKKDLQAEIDCIEDRGDVRVILDKFMDVSPTWRLEPHPVHDELRLMISGYIYDNYGWDAHSAAVECWNSVAPYRGYYRDWFPKLTVEQKELYRVVREYYTPDVISTFVMDLMYEIDQEIYSECIYANIEKFVERHQLLSLVIRRHEWHYQIYKPIREELLKNRFIPRWDLPYTGSGLIPLKYNPHNKQSSRRHLVSLPKPTLMKRLWNVWGALCGTSRETAPIHSLLGLPSL